MLLLVSALLSLPLLAKASVDLTDSIIFDEYDFVGLDADQGVSVPHCQYGCKIFASVKDQSKEFAKKLVVFKDGIALRSISEISDTYTEYGEKSGYEISNTNNVSIHNLNTDNSVKSGPLVIYVVARLARNYDHHMIYDASNMNRNNLGAYIVTVMSAQPFTVTVAPGKWTSATARLVGYDNIDEYNADQCTVAFQSTSSDEGFQLYINGPIISLIFENGELNTVDIKSDLNYVTDRSLDNPGFLSTPGFIGCYGSDGKLVQQVYRSSDYISNSTFNLSFSNRKVNFTSETEMYKNRDDSQLFSDLTNGANNWLVANFTDKDPYRFTIYDTQNVSVVPYNVGPISFLVRYSSDFLEYGRWPTTIAPTTTTEATTTTKGSTYGSALLGFAITLIWTRIIIA